MAYKVLVTTTSFIDTPGPHRDALYSAGFEIVTARGPLSEDALQSLIQSNGKFDGFLCGEDDVNAKVLEAASPRLRIVSKYGVGLDRIDLETAKKLGIAVTNTPGVNHTTVSELTLGLILSLVRKIPEHNAVVHRAEWKRFTGSELSGKTIGIIGLGRVGREVAKRAMAFGMRVLVYNTSWSAAHSTFVNDLTRAYSDPIFSEVKPSIAKSQTAEEVASQSDVLSLHINLSKANPCLLDRRMLSFCKRGMIIVNVSRGALVDQRALADALRSGQIAGYAADVLDPEPVQVGNPLIGVPNVHLTPHIGSRTFESVIRQGLAAFNNLNNVLKAEIAAAS